MLDPQLSKSCLGLQIAIASYIAPIKIDGIILLSTKPKFLPCGTLREDLAIKAEKNNVALSRIF
jgi:hypothetical protein